MKLIYKKRIHQKKEPSPPEIYDLDGIKIWLKYKYKDLKNITSSLSVDYHFPRFQFPSL